MQTYKVTGINLKAMPLGEADRLLTILTPEQGLIRVIAPAARKQNSKLGGRSGLFVVNALLITQGKSLDRINQAETVTSYAGLSRALSKLTAAQYLAELALHQALSDHPQVELFTLLTEHLSRIEQAQGDLSVLACLSHGVYQLLALAGLAPQAHRCCLTGTTLDWQGADRCGFSIEAGGAVNLDALAREQAALETEAIVPAPIGAVVGAATIQRVRSAPASYRTSGPRQTGPSKSGPTTPRLLPSRRNPRVMVPLLATELFLMQQLAQGSLDGIAAQTMPTGSAPEPAALEPAWLTPAWLTIERLLRQYAQFHFDQPIRSAALIDGCFAALAPQPISV
jgi:DNA repair protein RecO (recombination protein O)